MKCSQKHVTEDDIRHAIRSTEPQHTLTGILSCIRNESYDASTKTRPALFLATQPMPHTLGYEILSALLHWIKFHQYTISINGRSMPPDSDLSDMVEIFHVLSIDIVDCMQRVSTHAQPAAAKNEILPLFPIHITIFRDAAADPAPEAAIVLPESVPELFHACILPLMIRGELEKRGVWHGAHSVCSTDSLGMYRQDTVIGTHRRNNTAAAVAVRIARSDYFTMHAILFHCTAKSAAAEAADSPT